MSEVRLQKVLAQAGVGSRRQCEDFIRSGRVTVNRRTAILGCKVDPRVDEIRLDGERLRPPEAKSYIALYKPIGVVSSLRSQDDRPTVGELLDFQERLYPAGRLDVDSEGLILMTNDGDLTFRVTHPRYGHEKEYRVLLNRLPDKSELAAWRRGVVLPDGARARPAKVWVESKTKGPAWLRVVMQEGRKRQIRETAQVLGLRVRKLVRIRIGPVHLGDLRPGEWRVLSMEERRSLLRGAERGRRRRTGSSTAKKNRSRAGNRARRRQRKEG